MMARRTGRGWGFAIDYVKAIAEDEARIAELGDPLHDVAEALLPAAMAVFPAHSTWTALDLVTYAPEGLAERAEAFGLTVDDVAAWAFYENTDVPGLPDVGPGAYKRGEAVSKRLGAFVAFAPGKRTIALKKARASLARHKRNQKTHG